MNKDFKFFGKKNVLGKEQNIYVKINKKVDVQSKTKYIKCKGKFVKLITYIKENAKVGRIVKIKNKVSFINNVSKIKNKKIKNLLLKIYNKNAKIYFISDKKKWYGGVFTGFFSKDVMKNKDKYVYRNKTSETKIDDLAQNFHYEEIAGTFKTICNMIYDIGIPGDNIYIRPYIQFKKNNNMFIKFYWSHDSWIGPLLFSQREWHEIPLHVSHFTKIMEGNKSGHIHITSEMDKLENYNIICDRTLNKNYQNKTHTYLNAENLKELIDIIKTHGEKIFKDWSYQQIYPNTMFKNYFITANGKWNSKIKPIGDILKESEKKQLCYCINNLDFILYDILSIIQNGGIDEDKQSITLNRGTIFRTYIDDKNSSAYINYIENRT